MVHLYYVSLFNGSILYVSLFDGLFILRSFN